MLRTHIKNGFTLIELMIAVAIVGILAAIALPSYQQYVTKSRRTEAIAALHAIIVGLEKYYFNNHSYTTDLKQLPIQGANFKTDGANVITGSGAYRLEVSVDNGVFAAVAKTLSNGPQAGDSECATLMLYVNGKTSATTPGGTDTTAVCW